MPFPFPHLSPLVASKGPRPPLVALFSNGKLDTLTLGKGNPGLIGANDKDVALARGESIVDGILEVDNTEATIVTLTVGDDTNTANVTTTSNHSNGASVELDEVGDLASLNINLDSVVDLDQRIRVANAVEISLAHHGRELTYQPYKVPLL